MNEQKSTSPPPLDRWRFDAVLHGDQHKLWGAPSIAQATGLSESQVYRLVKKPEVPIYRPAGTGTLFAYRAELMAWLRTKPEDDG